MRPMKKYYNAKRISPKNWGEKEISYYKHSDAEFRGRNQEICYFCLKYPKYMISM